MALTTEDRSLVLQIVAWYAYLVRGRLSPVIDLADLGLVTVEAIVVRTRLVLPVHKLEVHVAHFEVDEFRPPMELFRRGTEGNQGQGQE